VSPFPPCNRKILVTLDFPPSRGGIQRYLDDIVRHTFTEYDLVIAPGPGDAADTTRHTCRIVRVPAFPRYIPDKLLLLPMAIRLFLELQRKGGGQTVVFAGNIFAALAVRLCALLTPVTWCCFTYGTELMITRQTSRLRTLLWRHLLKRAEHVYYLTAATRELLRTYLDPSTCIQMVPRIEIPAFTIHTLRSPDRQTLQILSVGRLVPHKGHATLVDAVALLDNVNLHCTIAGDGPDRLQLRQQIVRLDLKNKVTLYNDCDDEQLDHLYRSSDLFIFSSIDTLDAREGFGIVLLEAMARHCAIITSDCHAAKDIFSTEKPCAQFFWAADAQSLAHAIRTLADNQSLRTELVRNAFTLLRERYVW